MVGLVAVGICFFFMLCDLRGYGLLRNRGRVEKGGGRRVDGCMSVLRVRGTYYAGGCFSELRCLAILYFEL